MIGNKIQPFKIWCQKVLPNVYDDSLSYYEYLCKMNEYLNEVIEQMNTLTEAEEQFQEDLSSQWTAYKNGLNTEWTTYKTELNAEWNEYKTELTQAWTETKNYIDHYFDNLDVQTEINNKLDAMVLDGTMSSLIDAIISDDIPTTVTDWLTAHVTPVGSAVVVDDTLSITGAAADAKVTGDKLKLRQEIEYNFNNITDCNLLQSNGVHFFNVLNNSGNLANAPFNDWKDGQNWQIEVYDLSYFVFQIFRCPMGVNRRSAWRTYTKATSTWAPWGINSPYVRNDTTFNNLTDCDLIRTPSIYFFNVSNGNLAHAPFDDWKDGDAWILETYQTVDNGNFTFQIFHAIREGKRSAVRTWNGSWQDWGIHDANGNYKTLIEIGQGKTYTTLKAGFSASYGGNCIVKVYPGTYDLASEFATELTNHDYSHNLTLGYNNEYIFMAGSYVKCLLNATDLNNYSYFEPFKTAASDFKVDGLNIECTNTRYCVHDEQSGTGTYKHEYINCIMSYETTYPAEQQLFSQAIGGGMGEHGYINIDGGVYDATSVVSGYDIPISYHNGVSATCDGKIFIRNIYLKKGFLRFGMYGASTIKTPVVVNNCSMGANIQVFYETPQSENENFELIEWNNIVRT